MQFSAIESFIASNLSVYLDGGQEDYRHFVSETVNYRADEIVLLKYELQQAIDNPNVNWKGIAYWGDFILYDEKKSNLEIQLDFMLLTWDILFSDHVLNQEQTTNLRLWLSNHLSNTECINFDKIISQISAQTDEWKNLDYYNLLRFHHSAENDIVDLQHEIGTDVWCFNLRPASLAGTG